MAANLNYAPPDHAVMARGMLDAFRRDLEARLTKMALDAIRPAIEAESKKAVQELQATVDSVYDIRLHRSVIALILNNKELTSHGVTQ